MKIHAPMKQTKTGSGNMGGGRKCVCLSVCMHVLTFLKFSLWWEDSINITYIC